MQNQVFTLVKNQVIKKIQDHGVVYTPGRNVDHLGFLILAKLTLVMVFFLTSSMVLSRQKVMVLPQPGWPSFMVATPASSPRILSWPFQWDTGHQGCRLLLAHQETSGKNLPNNQFNQFEM